MAQLHISEKLNEFLAMQNCVHTDDPERHHRMRIRAKWLRYAMEFLSPLYGMELEEYITTTKQFQDILGQKHDLDVWIELVPNLMAEMTAEFISERKKTEEIADVENGLLTFLET